MLARATRAAVADVYEDLRPLIEATARGFARRYRRDPEEAVAEANLIFLQAYHTFRGGGGGNLRWRVRYVIRARLMDALRKEIRRNGIAAAPLAADPPARAAAPPDGGWLSRDARDVLWLVLNPEPALDAAVRAAGNPAGALRRCLRAYLAELGWAPARVKSAFAEIRELV